MHDVYDENTIRHYDDVFTRDLNTFFCAHVDPQCVKWKTFTFHYLRDAFWGKKKHIFYDENKCRRCVGRYLNINI